MKNKNLKLIELLKKDSEKIIKENELEKIINNLTNVINKKNDSIKILENIKKEENTKLLIIIQNLKNEIIQKIEFISNLEKTKKLDLKNLSEKIKIEKAKEYDLIKEKLIIFKNAKQSEIENSEKKIKILETENSLLKIKLKNFENENLNLKKKLTDFEKIIKDHNNKFVQEIIKKNSEIEKLNIEQKEVINELSKCINKKFITNFLVNLFNINSNLSGNSKIQLLESLSSILEFSNDDKKKVGLLK